MTREESEKGTKRAARGSAGNLANVKNLWNDAPIPTLVNKMTPPATMWSAPSAQYMPTSFALDHSNEAKIPDLQANPAWPGYARQNDYQPYYEAFPTPYAQWGQAYHQS